MPFCGLWKLFLHHLLHAPFPFGIGNLDEVNAAWQACHVDLQRVAVAADADDMLPKHVDHLGSAKALAHDGDLAVGGVGRKGDAVIASFVNARYGGRDTNRFRLFVTVNRRDAIFNVNISSKFHIGKIGLESKRNRRN